MYADSYSVREGVYCVTKKFVSSIRTIEQVIRAYEDHVLSADRIVLLNRRYRAVLYIYICSVYFERRMRVSVCIKLPRLSLRQMFHVGILLFVLLLNVQVNNFCRVGTFSCLQYLAEDKVLAQGHSSVHLVSLRLVTLRYQV